MAKKRTTTKSSSRTSTQAKMLFMQLKHQYADATPQEWDELRAHLDDQLAALAEGSPQRREGLVAEFERVRNETLTGRKTRQIIVSLAEGQAEFVRDRGDGLEEWQVAAGDETVRLFVPTDDGTAGVTVARKALLEGRCPSCRVGIEVAGGAAQVAHNSKCPARKVLD
jgi:hypothetical protein